MLDNKLKSLENHGMSGQNGVIIRLSNCRYREKEYVLRFIFEEYLGLSVAFEISGQDCVIETFNSKKIIISDSFFNRYDSVPYWSMDSLPKNSCFSTNEFTPEKDIPVLYGHPTVTVTDDKIYCGIDVVASVFFMLTRWEEYANPKRDAHQRFPLPESVAYQWGFHKRPIVNEYIEMLWAMLQKLGFQGERKKRESRLLITHDVDDPWRWNGPVKIARSLMGDLLVRKQVGLFFRNALKIVSVLLRRSKDPYDTFDYLMDISEKHHAKSYFFFMAGGITPHDKRYVPSNKKIRKLIQSIHSRGH